MRVELFVRNLLDTDTWQTVTGQTDITSDAFDFNSIRGVQVMPHEKRTFGLRVNYTF